MSQDQKLKIIRRKTNSIAGTPGYQLVYFLANEEGQEKEISRTSWNDMISFFGGTNFFEKGMLSAYRSLGFEVELVIDSKSVVS